MLKFSSWKLRSLKKMAIVDFELTDQGILERTWRKRYRDAPTTEVLGPAPIHYFIFSIRNALVLSTAPKMHWGYKWWRWSSVLALIYTALDCLVRCWWRQRLTQPGIYWLKYTKMKFACHCFNINEFGVKTQNCLLTKITYKRFFFSRSSICSNSKAQCRYI